MLLLSSIGSLSRTSRSPTVTDPESGSPLRLKQRRSVVLPEPLSPTIAVNDSAGTESETLSSATTGPNRLLTSCVSSDTDMAQQWSHSSLNANIFLTMVVSSIGRPIAPSARRSLSDQYRSVRSYTEKLCEPLEIED